MRPQKFLIAKYAQDVRRMEPQNIGILLWSKGLVLTRFLEPTEATFVNHRDIYTRWIQYWSRLARERSLELGRDGPMVSRSKPEFLDAIRKTQSGNYLLFDGGQVIEDLRRAEVAEALNYLFMELVARPGGPEEPQETLRTASDALFHDSGLSERPDFQKSYGIRCSVNQVEREFTFNYAIGNGVPESLFQRVRVDQEPSVNSSAFMFEWTQRSVGLPKGRLGAIVDADADTDESRVTSALDMLSQFAILIN